MTPEEVKLLVERLMSPEYLKVGECKAICDALTLLAQEREELRTVLRNIAFGNYSTFVVESAASNTAAQIINEMQRIARSALKDT